MKKQIIALFVAVLMLSGTITGCAGKNSSSSSAASAGEKQKITVYNWTAPASMAPVIKAVTEGTGIPIDYVQFAITDAGVKQNTLLASGVQIDVMGSTGGQYDKFIQRVKDGLFTPLDSYLKKENLDANKLYGSDWYNMAKSVDGKLYSIPYIRMRQLVFYNKSLFDKAGLAYPKDGWTWDDFRADAKILTQQNGANTIYGNISDPTSMWWIPAFTQLGANAFYKNSKESNFDNPAFKQSMQFFYNMMFVDKSMYPYKDFAAQNVSANRATLFYKGQYAMDIIPAYTLLQAGQAGYEHDFDVGVCSLPLVKAGGKETSTVGFDEWTIPASSKLKDEAWEFIKYDTMTRPDLCLAPLEKLPPANFTYLNNPKMAQAVQDVMLNIPHLDKAMAEKEIFDQTCIDIPSQPTVTNHWPEVQTIITEESTKCFIGEQSVDQALSNMKKRADAILTKG